MTPTHPQAGKHAAAHEAYTLAIDETQGSAHSLLPTLLCNRSLMASKLGKHDWSLADAEV